MRYSTASIAAFFALLPTGLALGITTATTSFQNGVNGYTGTFDMRISMTETRDGTLGTSGTNYLIDGYAPDNPETTMTNEFSPDEQGLLRFDNIFGGNPGQVPLGALILDAKLQMTTAGGNGDSPGPWGVAALLQPFTSATRYDEFPGGGPVGFRGAWWQDGPVADPNARYATRPASGFDGQVTTAGMNVDSADVRSLVQLWSDDPEGDNNHGLVLQAGWPGQTNGWGFNTTGTGNVAARPKLTVTYTTDDVAINTFQRDLNGYTDDTMAWVRSGFIQSASVTNPDETVDDITYDGYTGLPTVSPTSTIDPPPTQLTQFQQFLDGPNFTTMEGVLDSPDDLALLKFENVFGTGTEQSPADKEVAKAWLVLTTGDLSGNARSNGNWAIHAMERDWDVTSLYSNFGDVPGLQVDDNDVAPSEFFAQGMITGSEIWFNVTDYLEAVRNGASDFGLAVQSTGSADGWQVHLNGSPENAFRPRLVVVSDLAAVPPGLAGDFNDDGSVDAADYVLWRKNVGTSFDLNGNGDETGPSAGVVDQADYALWRAKFGTSAPGAAAFAAAVPEPASWLLICAAASVLPLVTSRKRLAV